MASIKQIDADINDMATFADLTKVYGEVALTRMNRVREDVLNNRRFLEELQLVFAQVQAAYLRKLQLNEGKQRMWQVKKEKISVLQHNGMEVMVLFSANTRLYGDILKRTFITFMQNVKKKRCEVTIIGKVGLTMYKEEMGSAQVTYFDFPDEKVDRKLLGNIIEHLVQYESVTICYPRFRNVIAQEPTMLTMSASQPMGNLPKTQTEQFFFEPSLEAAMAFFEKEIFATYFEQTVREAQLSKFAARAMSMDRAQQAIVDRRKKAVIKRRQLVKDLDNMKQLNLMPAYLELL
jgi:F0F1-type ATP synthase gamma subunit